MKKTILLCLILFTLTATVALAQNMTGEQEDACNEIKGTVDNITNLISIIGGSIATLALIVVGVMMFMSQDPAEKDQLKDKIKYIIMGIVLIVIAPQIVKFIAGSGTCA